MKNKNRQHEQSPNGNHSERDEVARRAYELYQARGEEPGHELEDWLRAEREFNKQGQAIKSP